MHTHTLYEDNQVKWVVFGRDPDKPKYVIDTNEYLIISNGVGMLLDPGGSEIFPQVISAVSDHIDLQNIRYIFGSHQDPDILSSLSLWLSVCPEVKVYVPWVWTEFITHFGCNAEQLVAIPDGGMTLDLSPGHSVECVPAHYLHSSGNHHIYDPRAKILFTGDVGAALMPAEAPALFVKDMAQHGAFMETFHRRWMPSNRARDVWIDRVRVLDIDFLCPQHGAIFSRKQVPEFLKWFSGLELGAAVAGA